MNTKRSLMKTIALPIALAMMLLLISGLPFQGLDKWVGSHAVYAASAAWDISTGDLVIGSGGTYRVTGSTTSNTINVNTSAVVTITFDNVFIDLSAVSDKCAFDSGGNVSLILMGSNTLKSGANEPGTKVTGSERLTVSCASSGGSLSTNGGSRGAGIGGGDQENGGIVTISGGTVSAIGGVTGAGIGGGYNGTGGSVSISNGTVTAKSSGWAAGIGGGYLKDGGSVMISAGTVAVTGGDYGAGIGGGYAGNGGSVIIAGGTVTVSGGIFGAGIGGGYGRSGGDVVITGGSIKAIGGSAAKNIGAGNLGANSGTLTNGYEAVTLRTINGAVAPVDPAEVSYQIAIIKPSYGYVYTYTGTGHGGGDTSLYFYLPSGVFTAPSLTSSPNPAVFGGTVTLTATVDQADGGNVEFFDGTASLGIVSLSGGTASLSTSALLPGTHNINAVYKGEFSNTISQVILPVLPAPTGLSAVSASYNSIKVSWTTVTGASGYTIERALTSTGTYSYLTSTTATSFTDTNLKTGSTYYYRVKGYITVGTTKVYGDVTTVISAIPVPSVADNFTVVKSSSSSIKVSWSGVAGAIGYAVYRATSLSGPYTVLTETKMTSYTNKSLITGKTYYYKVQAYRLVGTTKVYGAFTAVKSATP